MKRKYIGGALLLTGFVVGFLIPRPGFGDAASNDSPDANPAVANARLRSERSNSAEENPGTTEPIGTLLDKAFSEQSEIRATRQLMSALAQHRKETAPTFASYFSSIRFSKTDFNHWRLFFSSWGTFDGPAALAYIRKRFDQPALQKEFYYSVLKSWGREIPRGDMLLSAGNFLVTTPGTGADLAMEFVRELMAKDPEQGMALMVRLSDPEAVMEMAGAQLMKQAKKDMRTALERLSGAEGEEKLFLTGRLLNAWSETDPIAAAAWLAEQGYPVISPGDLNAIAANYVKSNPAAAFAWVNGLPDTLFSESLLEKSATAWSESDPASANAWLAALKPATELDPVVIAMTHVIADTSPETALETANNLVFDKAKGQETFFELAMEWKENKPEDFAKWLEDTSLLASEQKKRLTQREYHIDAPEAPAAGRPAQTRLYDGRE